MKYFNQYGDNISEHKNLSVNITSHLGGLMWKYKNKRGDVLSVILHSGSYGGGLGLFEIMPSWRKPNGEEGDSVEGFLTFGEVQEWIDELKSRDTKEV